MQKLLLLLILFISSSYFLFSQHIPHKIDNQWHYDMSASGGINYAAIVLERTEINSIEYFVIERRNCDTGELIEIVYDRMEGDSLYIRKVACPEELIINFNWPVGYIDVTALGNDCYNFKKLVSVTTKNFWGMNLQSYQFLLGNFCEGYTDTVWLPFMPEITQELGSFNAFDGAIVGAVINGVTYGTLYPLPVELTSFSAQAAGKNCVMLNWQTASEINNRGYEILRKKYEDLNWEKITFIEGKGTTSETQNYSYRDNDVKSGTWFYRLIQYDFDGTSKLVGETPVDMKFTPDALTLKQNYPNPFNPSTTIEYSIGSDELVVIKIYDVLGREEAVLLNEYKTAGNHNINFNAAGFSAGVYIYTIQAGVNTKSGSMILAK